MLSFKQSFIQLSLFIMTLVGMLLISSCSVDSPEERPVGYNENGSFYVGSVTKKGVTTVNDKVFGFPISRTWNIKICFKEKGTHRNIRKHKFEIGNKSYTTNENGCFVFKEKVKFNSLVFDSYFVTFERKIKSNGIHRGYQYLKYALNPQMRSSDEKGFYNLTNGEEAPEKILSVKESKKYLSGEGYRKAVLWVEKVDNVNLSSGGLTKHGYETTLELHITPQIKFANLGGKSVFREIPSGKFIVKPYLINKRDTSFFTDDKKVISVSVRNKHKQEDYEEMIDQKIKLTRTISIPVLPEKGEIELGLIVEPVKKQKYLGGVLRAFQGVYNFSGAGDMIGSKSGSLSAESTNKLSIFKSDDSDFELSEYVDDLDANFVKSIFLDFSEHSAYIENAEKTGEKITDDKLKIRHISHSGWSINRLNIEVKRPRFQSYGKMSLPTMDVNFNLAVCIRDPFNSNKPIRNHMFKISTTYKNEFGKRDIIERPTDSNGCLSWPDRLTFKVYDKEHYFIRYFIVESEELNFKERRGVAINPWDFGFTFGFSLVDRQDLLKGQDLDKKPASTLYIPDFTYRNLGFDYRIDENLKLILRKHMIIRIHPEYMAYHSITRFKPFWPLYPGKYLMKLVMMRNFYEDPYHAGEYISHFTKFVEVFKGRIMTDVTFEIDDVRLMGSRNILMIEIFPVYENQLMEDKTTGRIVPKDQDIREDKTKKSWDQLIARDSGLVSKPYIGPTIILTETGGAPTFPSDKSTRLNTMSTYNRDKLMSALKNGSKKVRVAIKQLADGAPFQKVMKGLDKKTQDQVIEVVEEQFQIPKFDNITGKEVDDINGAFTGDNYIPKGKLSEYIRIAKKEMNFPIPEAVTTIANKYEKSNITDGNENVVDGLHKTHPNMRDGEGPLKVAKHRNKSIQTEKAYLFGEFDESGPEAEFIGESYYQGMKQLHQMLNVGEGYDENGKKVYKQVDVNKLEVVDLIKIKYLDRRTGEERIGYGPPRYNIGTTEMIERGEAMMESKWQDALEKSDIKYFLQKNYLTPITLTNREQTEDFLLRLTNPLWHKREHELYPLFMSGRMHMLPQNFYMMGGQRENLGIQTEDEIQIIPGFSEDELRKFIRTGEMNSEMLTKLCRYWYYDHAQNVIGKDVFESEGNPNRMYLNKGGNEILPQGNYHAANICKMHDENYWNAFVIERKLIIHNLKSFQHQKGLSVNMNVNVGSRWGYGHSESNSESSGKKIGFDLDTLLPVKQPFSAGVFKAWTNSSSENFNNGVDGGSGSSVNLVVQRNEFDLTVDEFEECISIKINPMGLVNKFVSSDIYAMKNGTTVRWNKELTDEERKIFNNSGLFICTGIKIEEEITLPENYYYITQHFNVGHSFDMASIKNRYFDLSIRGDQTLTLFSSLLYDEQFGSANNKPIQTPIGRINDPLFALLPIYSKLPASFSRVYSLPVDPRTFAGFKWKMDMLK